MARRLVRSRCGFAFLVHVCSSCVLPSATEAAETWTDAQPGLALVQLRAQPAQSGGVLGGGKDQTHKQTEYVEKAIPQPWWWANVTREFPEEAAIDEWAPPRAKDDFVFIGIPGNAGDAIEDALVENVFYPGKLPAFQRHIQMPDQTWCSKRRAPPAYLQAAPDDAEIFQAPTFCVARHPYERAVDNYIELVSAEPEILTTMRRMGLLQPPDCSAEGMNWFLQVTLQRMLEGHEFVLNCRFAQQAKFVWGRDGQQWCHKILPDGELTGTLSRVMGVSGVDLQWHSLATNYTACSNLTADSLSLATKRLLDKVYNEDFERLNYSKPLRNVLFMEIPRNAARAIRDVAQGWLRTVPSTWADDVSPEHLPGKGSCSRNAVPPDHLDRDDQQLFDDADVFCVVHHPYERAVSLYTSLLSLEDGIDIANASGLDLFQHAPCSARGLNAFVQSAVTMYQQNQGTLPGRPGTFMLMCNMVPQEQYVWGRSGRQWCKDVVRAEALLPNASFNHLMASRGFPNLRLTKEPQSSSLRCPHLSRKSLTAETKKIVHDMYINDFKRFDYEP